MANEITVKQLRTFGLMVGGTFAILGVWPALFLSADPRWWAIALAGVLAFPALIFPQSLQPVYRVWMAVGHGLGWINTRIILSVVFYGLFTPLGVVMRWLGKDPLHLQLEPGVDTYRTLCHVRPTDHLKRQF
jgi:hypothetical protein